jgi:uncharacterized membrane protein
MRWKVIASFFLILSLFMHMVIIFASTTNGLFQIDNYYKAALPGDSVNFDMTLVNNEVNRETFLIHHVWENSVLYLPMDLVDNQVYDYSSFRNHGTVYGASWVDGKYGKALSFNGVNDYVSVLDALTLRTNLFTLMCWFKPVNLIGDDHRLFDKMDAGGFPGYDLRNNVGTNIQVRVGTTTASVWINTGNLTNGVLYHLAVTYNGAYVRLYVNNVLTGGPAALTGDVSNSKTLTIGSYTDSPTTYSINGIIDEVRVFNRALTAEEIGWLYNNSWSERLSEYTVELGPGESTQVTFSVKVPENASAGLVKFLLTAFPTSNPEHVETQTVTVEVLPKYGVEVSLDENEKKGKPGEILNFQAAIRNLGNIEDTYDIKAEGGEGWNLSLPAESITVPAEEVGSFNISVTVPLDALPGDYTSFRIQAASRGNQNLTTNVNGTAIATAIYRFNITADPELMQASPGSEAIFSLELKNLGTAPDTIGLEAENLIGWDIKVEPSNISLEIGETGKATVRVRVPENALIGQTNTITIRAVSSGDPTVSANSSISIEVVTPFWDIPDVRFLVGLSIGVLVGATLISTLILRRGRINRKESRRS